MYGITKGMVEEKPELKKVILFRYKAWKRGKGEKMKNGSLKQEGLEDGWCLLSVDL